VTGVKAKPELRAPVIEIRSSEPRKMIDGSIHQVHSVYLEGICIDWSSHREAADRTVRRLTRALRGFRKPVRRRSS